MSVPRVLLLMPWSPGALHAGDVFVRDLLRHYPRQQLCGFGLTIGYAGPRPQRCDFEGFPFVCVPHPPEYGITKLGRQVAHLHTLLVHQYLKHIRVPTLVGEAVRFGRENGVNMVWAILNQHPALTYMVGPVVKALDVPLVTTVMDPPERFMVDHGMTGIARRVTLRLIGDAFEAALRVSVRCGVASEGMQEEYKRLYGLDPVVLVHGLHPSRRRPPATGLTNPDRLVIGFAGGLYARQEWEALLGALDRAGWCIEGREVMIRLVGGSVNLRAQGKMHVEYLGWRSLEETLEFLSDCDISYLPYWFDAAYRQAVRLSFPNKLSTYVAAGRPVFYHGPRDASPVRFFQRFPVGLCCHSLDETDIIESLQRFVIDREFYASATRQTQAAVDQELNLFVFLRRFATLIGVSEEELLLPSESDQGHGS